MDRFTISLWLRVLRALVLAGYTGVTQYVLSTLATRDMSSAAVLGLLCLMSTILAVPLGTLADIGNYQVSVFIVFVEPINVALLLAAAILSCLQIKFSHSLVNLGAISALTYFLVEAAAALALLGMALSCILLVMSFHNVGSTAPEQNTCNPQDMNSAQNMKNTGDIEAYPRDEEYEDLTDLNMSAKNSYLYRASIPIDLQSIPPCLTDPSKIIPA